MGITDGKLKGHTATVNYEGTPVEIDHDTVLSFAKKHATDKEDLRELLTALGYVPYMGIQSKSGKYTRVLREAQFTLNEGE